MPSRPFRIQLRTFNAAVSFFIGDFQEFTQWLNKRYGMIPDRDCSLAGAGTFDIYRMDSADICAVWIPEDNAQYIPVVAHEIVHAIGLVCMRRGILYSNENTEVIAYLTEYMLSEYIKKSA